MPNIDNVTIADRLRVAADAAAKMRETPAAPTDTSGATARPPTSERAAPASRPNG